MDLPMMLHASFLGNVHGLGDLGVFRCSFCLQKLAYGGGGSKKKTHGTWKVVFFLRNVVRIWQLDVEASSGRAISWSMLNKPVNFFNLKASMSIINFNLNHFNHFNTSKPSRTPEWLDDYGD